MALLVTRAVSIENLDTKDPCLFSNTICAGADCSTDMGSVAVTVGVVVVASKIFEERGAALELLFMWPG